MHLWTWMYLWIDCENMFPFRFSVILQQLPQQLQSHTNQCLHILSEKITRDMSHAGFYLQTGAGSTKSFGIFHQNYCFGFMTYGFSVSGSDSQLSKNESIQMQQADVRRSAYR